MASAWSAAWGSSWGSAWGGVAGQTKANEITLRKVYLKRGKKLLLFNTAQEADAFAAAEQAANEAIEQAQKTSRRARKRIRDRIYPAAESIDTEQLALLSMRFDLHADVPLLVQRQDYEEIERVALVALKMQDEEDIEMLLVL